MLTLRRIFIIGILCLLHGISAYADQPDIQIVDGKVMCEDAIIIALSHFTVVIPGFYDEGGVPEEGYAPLQSDYSDITEDLVIDYLLWDYMGPYGDIFDTDIHIIPRDSDFSIVAVEQQFTTTLLFNEDGSGGVWSAGNIENSISDWVEIEKVSHEYYHTLSQEALAEHKPPIDEESVMNAESLCMARDIPTTFDEYVSNAKIRINWATMNDTVRTTLNFDFIYGD